MKMSWNKTGILAAIVAVSLGMFLPISIKAGKSTSDLSTLKKDFVCKDSSKEYYYNGSTNKYNITNYKICPQY